MRRIAVLASGGGTNLQALFDAQANGILHSGSICLVVCDKCDAYALQRAEQQNVPAFCLSRKILGRTVMEEQLHCLLDRYQADLIVLAGFLTILSEDFVKRYPRKIVNIHPSLIPSFCGKGFYGHHVHEAAIERGVKLSGATVHFVNEIPDGGEILSQRALAVLPEDTPTTLAERILTTIEWPLLSETVEAVCKQQEEEMQLEEYLKNNAYPGRGILVGKAEDGRAVVAYFITARSKHSRNRVLCQVGKEIRTEAVDPSLLVDPSLIIYPAFKPTEGRLVVSNGDQTQTVVDLMSEGKSFEQALSTREYEPDEPNFTPRITALLSLKQDYSYTLSILKHKDGECERVYFNYENTPPGEGHLIHTYEGDGNPLPTFSGEPRSMMVKGGVAALSQAIWNSLDAQNRVALAVQFIDLATGNVEQQIINAQERIV